MPRAFIIGGGHNALVSAFYLSEAGFEVAIAERSSTLGGACVPRYEACGCLLYPGANHFGMLHPKISGDLSRAGVVLRTIRPAAQMLVPMATHRSIVLSDDLDASLRSLKQHSLRDAEMFPHFTSDLASATEILRQSRADPSKTLDDFVDSLGKINSEFPELFAIGSIAHTLERYFVTPAIQGALASSMLLFNAGPRRRGTAFALPYYAMMGVEGRSGWEMLAGGMGSLTSSLGSLLEARGCKILLNTTIKMLEVADGAVVAARSHTGERFEGDYFIAGCDPLVVAKLLGRGGFTSMGWEKLRALWKRESFRGMCGKALYLLKRAPTVKDLPPAQQALAAGTMVSNLCSLSMMSDAYRTAQCSGISERPYLEVLLPSVLDPSQSCGRHVTASVYYMYSRYRHHLTSEQRAQEVASVRGALDEIYEDFHENVEAEYVLTNKDIATEFGMSFGNVDHGSLVPEYAMGARGLPGTCPPRTDLHNLILASSGSTPGGLVSGVPGFIAAQALLES